MSKATLLNRIDVAQAFADESDAEKFAMLRTEIEALDGDEVSREEFVAAYERVDAAFAN